MNTDPQQIRVQVEALLADLPRVDPNAPEDPIAQGMSGALEDLDIDAVGRRLEEAHQVLVDALESVEKG
ncbi:MAG: hypothetical protein KDB71_18680 [Mycobacterium sp.]|nr:hypothetical protein [Mycobacterium sp.]